MGAIVGMRDLTRRTAEVIEEVEKSGKATLVTRHGKPAVLIAPVNTDEWEDWVLATAPEFVQSMKEAEDAIRRGDVVDLETALAEIEEEERASERKARAARSSRKKRSSSSSR